MDVNRLMRLVHEEKERKAAVAERWAKEELQVKEAAKEAHRLKMVGQDAPKSASDDR